MEITKCGQPRSMKGRSTCNSRGNDHTSSTRTDHFRQCEYLEAGRSHGLAQPGNRGAELSSSSYPSWLLLLRVCHLKLAIHFVVVCHSIYNLCVLFHVFLRQTNLSIIFHSDSCILCCSMCIILPYAAICFGPSCNILVK